MSKSMGLLLFLELLGDTETGKMTVTVPRSEIKVPHEKRI
jgi:hypothetical protein